MRVYALSRGKFDKLMKTNNITNDNVEEKDIFFISINNINDPTYEPHFINKSNVSVMYFDDVEFDTTYINLRDTKRPYVNMAFTEGQGKELIEFINRNRNKSQCVVHCTAGISRSGAVASFINSYLGGDYDTFKRDNPLISPNAHVLSVLNKLINQ